MSPATAPLIPPATAQEPARAWTQRPQLLLESTGEGLFGIDADDRCTSINRADAQTPGWTTDQVLGKNMHDPIHHTHGDGEPDSRCEIGRWGGAGRGRDLRRHCRASAAGVRLTDEHLVELISGIQDELPGCGYRRATCQLRRATMPSTTNSSRVSWPSMAWGSSGGAASFAPPTVITTSRSSPTSTAMAFLPSPICRSDGPSQTKPTRRSVG